MSQNLVEKIAQKYTAGNTSGRRLRSGDFLTIRPAYVMTHDNTGAVIPKFRSIGASKIADPRQVVFTLDHNIQDTGEKNMKKYRMIERFAGEMGVDFYPAGRGIGHQIMCEEGYAWPGTFVVASDSHSNMYGGLGCLGTPVVRTDAAAIWASGHTWWQIPPVARVFLEGRLKQGVTGKDIIISLCGVFNHDEVLNHAVEFHGDGIAHLDIDQRLTIANMTTEWGALAGVFPVDDRTIEWLTRRAEFITRRGPAGVPSDTDGNGGHPRLTPERIAELDQNRPAPDADAYYSRDLTIHLDSIQPHVSGPNSVKLMTSIADMNQRDIKIQKAYLVSCVNSRVEDIAEAAGMVRGKKVAPGVEFYVSAASSEVQELSEQSGDWQDLLDAGAIPLPPGCGPCIGLGAGLLQDGEVGISATNRNFRGRMGSRQADAYLASPSVVAASAVAGKITYPGNWTSKPPLGETTVNPRPGEEDDDTEIIEGFSPYIRGEMIYCHQDNLNTDGIYPGKYTYIDEFTPGQQAEVVMENYDPDFGKLVRDGDILIGGFNFGSGSSREQAATALKYRGIRMVIAGSFSETYKRNALNNGFLVIEVPELVGELKKRFGTDRLTVRTGLEIEIDFRRSTASVAGQNYPIGPVGVPAQELLVRGGLEEWVKKKISEDN